MTSEAGCMAAGKGWRGEALLTAELRLRPPTHDDVPALTRQANDPDIARWTAELPHPFHSEDARKFVDQAAQDRLDGQDITLVIERLSDQEVIGAINLARDQQEGRLGYWIGRSHWGNGYATQAILRMTRLGFQSLGMTTLHAHVMQDNRPSARALEKAGYSGSQVLSCELSGRCQDVPVTLFRIDLKTWRMLQSAKPLVLVVAAALIDADNRVLLARRPDDKPMAGLWEFPGGKIHAGESPEAALLRELKEELGIDASESCLAPLTFASHDYDGFQLLMPLFVLRQWKGTPHAHEGQKLAWVKKERLGDYPMPPADLPLVPILKDWL